MKLALSWYHPLRNCLAYLAILCIFCGLIFPPCWFWRLHRWAGRWLYCFHNYLDLWWFDLPRCLLCCLSLDFDFRNRVRIIVAARTTIQCLCEAFSQNLVWPAQIIQSYLPCLLWLIYGPWETRTSTWFYKDACKSAFASSHEISKMLFRLAFQAQKEVGFCVWKDRVLNTCSGSVYGSSNVCLV